MFMSLLSIRCDSLEVPVMLTSLWMPINSIVPGTEWRVYHLLLKRWGIGYKYETIPRALCQLEYLLWPTQISLAPLVQGRWHSSCHLFEERRWAGWGEGRVGTRKFENESTERNSKVIMCTVCPEGGQTCYQNCSSCCSTWMHVPRWAPF